MVVVVGASLVIVEHIKGASNPAKVWHQPSPGWAEPLEVDVHREGSAMSLFVDRCNLCDSPALPWPPQQILFPCCHFAH